MAMSFQMGLFLRTCVPKLVSDRFRDGLHQARASGILNLRDDQCVHFPTPLYVFKE